MKVRLYPLLLQTAGPPPPPRPPSQYILTRDSYSIAWLLSLFQIVTAEEAAAHRAATTKGAMRGGAFGVGIIAPSHFLLQRKAFYRSIPITLKTLAYVCLLVPCVSIGGEKAGEAFERSRWTGVAARELEREKAKEETKWETLNTGGKVKEWAKTNKWGLIAARLVMEGGLQGGGYQLVGNGGSEAK